MPSHMWRTEDNPSCLTLYPILFETGSPCFVTVYIKLADSWVSKDTPYLSIETLGLQMLMLGIWLFTPSGDWSSGPCGFDSKCSYPLSRLPQPTTPFFYTNISPFQGLASNLTSASLPLLPLPRTIFPSSLPAIQLLAHQTCLQNAVSEEDYSMFTAPSVFLEHIKYRKTSRSTHG